MLEKYLIYVLYYVSQFISFHQLTRNLNGQDFNRKAGKEATSKSKDRLSYMV